MFQMIRSTAHIAVLHAYFYHHCIISLLYHLLHQFCSLFSNKDYNESQAKTVILFIISVPSLHLSMWLYADLQYFAPATIPVTDHFVLSRYCCVATTHKAYLLLCWNLQALWTQLITYR